MEELNISPEPETKALLEPSQDEAESLPHDDPWGPLSNIPVQLQVSIPLAQYSISEILALAPGQVLASSWPTNQHVPLAAGSVFLASVDFERAGDNLGVRISGFHPTQA